MADEKKTDAKSGPQVKVVLRPNVHVRIDSTDYHGGDTVSVDKEGADNLLEQGLADREGDTSGAKADEDQAKAEAEANEAAADAERVKLRSAEATRAAINEPPLVRRGRPPREG